MRGSAPEARLLDVSRLVSRAGRALTGVDRVERAYLDALLKSDCRAWGLVRTPIGFLLLDEKGLKGLADRIDGQTPWGEASRLSKIFSKLSPMQRRALSDMRKLAVGRTHKRGLGRLLKRKLPVNTAYLNTGHSNFTDFVVAGVKALKGGTIAVFVHDTIPLDAPEYQTSESAQRFELFLRRVSARANLVIYNSAATRQAAEARLEAYGRCPQGLVAHLGLETFTANASALPKTMPPEQPYFVTVGTLEPRKNHTFLLSVWEQMEKQTPPQNMPELVMVGARGWKNEEFFYQLDHSRLKGEFIHELGDISDGAMAALLDGASGALFPSLAEGYGLPVFEALARGTPVICNDLPVYREIGKDIPVYASVNDSYLWIRRIMTLAKGSNAERDRAKNAFKAPTWKAHFKTVLSQT